MGLGRIVPVRLRQILELLIQAHDRYRKIAQARQVTRHPIDMCLRATLVVDNVAHIVHPVFDLPLDTQALDRSRHGKQPSLIHFAIRPISAVLK